jgi:enoyl-CoA hydratase/carnithine racemase
MSSTLLGMISSERHGTATVLRFNRPDARNAMSTALLELLLDALADTAADADVEALVLAGAGGTFSAGADLREELDHEASVRRMDLFCQVYEAVATYPKPTLAAIEGHCVGGGIEVAAATDIRVADPTASFRFPGATLGIAVGAAKTIGLIGLGAAKDLVLTARTFGTEEAWRLGFVQRIADPGAAVPLALEIAAQITANNPQAVAHLRRQFAAFSGLADRVAAENDVLHALTEAGGDYSAVTAPHSVGGRAPGVGRAR